MDCQLCNDSKVVYTTIENYGMQIGPCPNCTEYQHEHYERELESVIKDDQQVRITQGANSR